MGFNRWVRGLFARDAASQRLAPAPDAQKPTVTTDAATDPLDALRGLEIAAAVAHAIALLDGTRDAAAASALVAWLRSVTERDGTPSDVRMTLAEFFSARGDDAATERALIPLGARGDAIAAVALARLADLADHRGDTAAVRGLYERVLAIDIGHPGIRARLERTRAPVRAGAAGATLLSPEAARLARGSLELVRELGRGGAGAVFLARDPRMAREVAVKIYHPNRRTERVVRLRAEAQVAASLASRHVVRVFDLLEALGAVSMEYCAGGTLRTAIAHREGTVDERRAWLLGVARALAVTHARGWVHRDLKPGNVLFRGDGAPVLTDFGLAHRVGTAVEPHEGTAGYVPPEARDHVTADPRMDVYAFGALAREVVGDADPVLGAVLTASSAREPEARPRDGEALVRAIENAGIVDAEPRT